MKGGTTIDLLSEAPGGLAWKVPQDKGAFQEEFHVLGAFKIPILKQFQCQC